MVENRAGRGILGQERRQFMASTSNHVERGELSRAGCASDSSVNGTRAGARYTGGGWGRSQGEHADRAPKRIREQAAWLHGGGESAGDSGRYTGAGSVIYKSVVCL